MENGKMLRPWVSFCMSTYKRPLLLKQQLELILRQSFLNFEIVISDNDPDCSARNVIESIHDARLKYFPNIENLGMLKSFNKSIERSISDYIIMITDDDPVLPEMVENFYKIVQQNPGYGIYIGCSRTKKDEGAIEVFDADNFLFQLLNPDLTENLLWSSCVLKKDALLNIGGIPDYGSPHLADHAMMALCGIKDGGVMINKMYSQLTNHDNNFSKSNIDLYFIACKQFYKLISEKVKKEIYIKGNKNALIKHIDRWFITSMFSLMKYFTYQNKRKDIVEQIYLESNKVLQLTFMKHLKASYYLKLLVFNLKRPLYLFNILR